MPEDVERRRANNRASYYKRRPECIKTVMEWRAQNPDKVLTYHARYWEKNKERVSRERKQKMALAFANDPKGTWLLITFRAARNRAARQGIPFDREIPSLTLPDVCPVLGLTINYHRASGRHGHDSPSLDRIIPARGYVADNVRVISNRANVLKRDATLNELRMILKDAENINDC